jgi:hypothetical protein
VPTVEIANTVVNGKQPVPLYHTAHARGRDKWARVSHFLNQWHYSDTMILLRVMGLAGRGSAATLHRWVTQGLLHRARADQSPYSPLYLLTQKGLAETYRPVDPDYETRPSAIKLREVRHDLAVQRAVLGLNPRKVIPGRLLSSYYWQQHRKVLTTGQNAKDSIQEGIEKLCTDPYWQAIACKHRMDEGETLSDREARLFGEYEPRITASDQRHYFALTQALAEAEQDLEALRDQEQDYERAHLPDAIAFSAHGPLALEVERSVKNTRRFHHIIHAHLKNVQRGLYARVEYRCNGFADLLRSRFDRLKFKAERTLFTFQDDDIF